MRFLKRNIFFIILIFITLIPLFDLLHPGLPITHDGQDHVARIANFYRNLEEGNLIPRWAANLNWGYGHPILMFLYPLPSYLASVFHFLGFSLVDSIKIVFGLSFILSGFAFYFWLKNFLPKEGALFGAALYTLAPYRFIDLYVRGALGEHVAFLFMPLVLYFILMISKKYSKKNVVGGAFSLAGLMLSHNAISLMFLPIAVLYSIFLYSKQKDYVKGLALMFLLGMGLSSFFWIPAFFEGKYTLRDIVTAGDYKNRFVEFKDFLYGAWNYGGTAEFTKQLGIVQWIMTVLSLPAIIYLYKNKNKVWILTFGSLMVLSVTFFLMLPNSGFVWEHIKTLQKFQFPWRFLSVSVLATSVLGALVFSQIKKYKTPLLIVALAFLLFFNRGYWRAQEYKVFPEKFFTGIYNGTTDTGESSPIWSVRFMEKRPKADMEVIKGKAQIKELKRSSTYHEYSLKVDSLSRIRENTLYFPGWSVFLDGKALSLEFQDPSNRGIITFYSNAGNHNLVAKFEETRLRLFADYLSLFSLITLFFLVKFRKV